MGVKRFRDGDSRLPVGTRFGTRPQSATTSSVDGGGSWLELVPPARMGVDQNGDVLGGMGLGDDPTSGTMRRPLTTRSRRKASRSARNDFKSGGEELTELSDEYSVPSVGTMKVVVYLVHGARVTTQEGDSRSGLPLAKKKGGKGTWYAFIDAHSPIFTRVRRRPHRSFLAELAHHLKVRASSARAADSPRRVS